MMTVFDVNFSLRKQAEEGIDQALGSERLRLRSC